VVFPIELPPLRHRREDVPLLVEHFIRKHGRDAGRRVMGVQPAAMQALMAHDWPGNVRELENLLTQASVYARNAVITPDLLHLGGSRARSDGSDAAVSPDMPAEAAVLCTLDEIEAEHIQRVLYYTGGHKGRTTEVLGISRPALDRKIGKYGLKVPGR
jgi:DNA-binding NtrC family response regulator